MARGRISKPAFGTIIPLKEWHPIVHSKVGPILRAHRILDYDGENFFPCFFHAVKATGKAVCTVYLGKLGATMKAANGYTLENCEERVAKLERNGNEWQVTETVLPEVSDKVLAKFIIQAVLPS